MDAASIGVLRDVALWVWVALAFGAGAYHVLRTARPALAWNGAGRVDASQYRAMDGVVGGAFLVLLLGNLTADQTKSTETFELSALPLLASMAVVLAICIALLFYLRVVRGLNPAELFGLRQQGLLRAAGLACVFIIPTLLLVNLFGATIMEWLKSFWPVDSAQDTVEAFRKSDSIVAKALMAVAAVIVAPLVEETLFRGFIYGVIKRYTDGYFAAVCSALLFATIHFHVGSLLPLTVLALAFCLAYEVTGSLVVPMFMHALFNATSLALLAVSGDHG